MKITKARPMQEWTLQEFQIYFGHDTTKEQD